MLEATMEGSAVEQRDAFLVRHSKSLDDLQWILQQATKEGWRVRAREADCYFSAGLLRDFFIGELNGQRISCISVVRHGEALVFVAFYIVLKDFRGKGYGLRTWKAAFDKSGVNDDCTIHLLAVNEMQDMYSKWMGLQPYWVIRRYSFSISHAKKCLNDFPLPPSITKIVPAKEANFEEVTAYGADMMIPSQACRLLQAAWLVHAQESSWVAIGTAGEVVGYLIMNETARFPEQGYRIGPFFADSAPIARSLLKVAAEFAALSNADSTMVLGISPDLNPDGINIVEAELAGKPTLEVIFMTNKYDVNKPHEKIFGSASEIM